MNPAIHVLIMCQGDQKRLGEAVDRPKQLLHLEAIAEEDGPYSWPRARRTTILDRTLGMIAQRGIDHPILVEKNPNHRVTIVGGVPFARHLMLPITKILSLYGAYLEIDQGDVLTTGIFTLGAPGNSSIKGIKRTLDWDTNDPLKMGAYPHRVVILLGDVVYSWACLRALFEPIPSPGPTDIRFVGTSNLSASEGEIFGVSLGNDWHTGLGGSAYANLEIAIKDHPPEENIYQPGQIRRWLKACLGSLRVESNLYAPIDDYTDDIDVPDDLKNLPELAKAALADDKANDYQW